MLDALFRPRSVAVIGASNEPLSIGHKVLQNLLDHGFRGTIHLVNPRVSAIGTFRTYPSIMDVPGEVDLVNIAVRNTLVPAVLEECGRKGVKFAIVHAAGFKEAGEEGRALERRILEIARGYGMRLFGPNAQGIQNSDPAVSVYANFTFVPMTPGNVSILAQSGGVGETLKLHLHRAGLGLRLYASYGNESDVSLAECLDYCGRDPGTRVLMIHLETFKDPASFLEAASRIAGRKPVLVVKSGRTPEGTRAAASHTGLLLEQDDLADAIFEKSGVVRFRSQEEMVEAAIALSLQPYPQGRRVAVLTNTGGPAILGLDEGLAGGLRLADLSPESRSALGRILPPQAALANPVDVLATAGPESFGAALETLLADLGVDAVLLVFVTAPFVDCPGIARRMGTIAAASAKPIVCQVITLDPQGEVVRTLRGHGVPVYEFAEAAAKALAVMTGYSLRAGRKGTPEPVPPSGMSPARSAGVEAILGRYRGKNAWLPLSEACRLLRLYGIPVADFVVVADRADLAGAADGVGYPLILKADSGTIIHKTEAGAVSPGLKDIGELESAFDRMTAKGPIDKVRYIVQKQAKGGREVILGFEANPGLAPTILFGLGGIFVEALKDTQFRLAPLSEEEASGMIRSIRGFPILAGIRGAKPADIGALVDMLLRFSRLAMECPEIAEADLNPVIALDEGDGAVVVDARFRAI